MMKICLMSGAVINAGDFLIENRAHALINHFIPGSEVTVLNRVTEDYSERVGLLNEFDAIIFGGGPIYQPGLYPQRLPFVNQEVLRKGDIKTPVFFLGGGLKGSLYQSSFSNLDRLFFDTGKHEYVPFGCRDILTCRFLRHQGYKPLLTGCPAWYYLPKVNDTSLRNSNPDHIKKICVSEPGLERNVPLLFALLSHLRRVFPNAEILLVNHRETKGSIMCKEAILNEKGIKIVNISGSLEGFSVYDDCDLHTGFRVHAHIYNLSHRNLTILFNEDVRGNGVNLTLGLENINMESPSFIKKKLYGNYYLIRYTPRTIDINTEVGMLFDDYLDYTIAQNFNNYTDAFIRMKSYFQNMETWFSGVRDNCV